jgi:hypothetical protein
LQQEVVVTIVIPTNGQSVISPPGASPTFETVSLTARDGRALNLKHLTPTPKQARGPVLMIVGTGTRANIFNPPTTTTLPQMLHDSGFDVCVLNWRSSIDLPAVEYTLDDAAVLDMPAAVNEVRAARTSVDAIKAVIHCQGSCAFMMAITAGLLPGVSVVISNSSSLHPIMPRIARIKLQIAVGLLAHREPNINPPVGDSRASTRAEGAQRGDPCHPPRMPQRGSDSMAVVDPELRVYGVERCGSSTPARCPSCRRATAMRASS